MATGRDRVRPLDPGTLQTLPAHTPTAFVPGRFRAAWHHADATWARRTGDLGLAGAGRAGLRSGDVSLPERRRPVSFAHLLYAPPRWTPERDRAYTALALPQEPDAFGSRLHQAVDAVAQRAACGFPTTDCAPSRRDRLHRKRRDALALPPRMLPRRRTIEGARPRVRLEDR